MAIYFWHTTMYRERERDRRIERIASEDTYINENCNIPKKNVCDETLLLDTVFEFCIVRSLILSDPIPAMTRLRRKIRRRRAAAAAAAEGSAPGGPPAEAGREMETGTESVR